MAVCAELMTGHNMIPKHRFKILCALRLIKKFLLCAFARYFLYFESKCLVVNLSKTNQNTSIVLILIKIIEKAYNIIM